MVSEPFFAKFLEILTTGSLEIGKFMQKQPVSIFWATAHALHSFGNSGKAENWWVLCTVTFSNIFLWLKTKTINSLRQLWRKIVLIVWALRKENNRCIDGMFVFYNPCARAESHQQERAEKTVFGLLKRMRCHEVSSTRVSVVRTYDCKVNKLQASFLNAFPWQCKNVICLSANLSTAFLIIQFRIPLLFFLLGKRLFLRQMYFSIQNLPVPLAIGHTRTSLIVSISNSPALVATQI